MGDIDDPAAAVTQHIDDPEQMLYLFLSQGGCRLVKYDHLGIIGNRLGDLHHLSLGYGHGAHHGLRVHVHIQLLEQLFRGLVHLGFTGQRTPFGDLREPAQPHVIHNIAL